METHKAFATCASQYSWNTVIENHSNVKEIWSWHGLQAWTSVSYSYTERLGNLGSPFTLKQTWTYALVISNRRTAGTLTFVKTMAVFSTVCMFYYILPYLPLYIKCHTFPNTKGTMQKVKSWYICLAIPLPCQGIGCVVNTDWYIILIGGESSLASESWCLRYKYQARSWGIL